MAFAIQWHCQQGTRTADNRDRAGVGIRGDSITVCARDRATAGRLVCDDNRRHHSRDHYGTARLTHAALAGDFQRDSASYVLFCADTARRAIALHAGDCLLGHRDGEGQISWLIQPHTLANALSAVPHAILAKLDARHVLTRSFRSRNFVAPDLTLVDLQDQVLFIGTDGFWADLDPDVQSAFAEGGADQRGRA